MSQNIVLNNLLNFSKLLYVFFNISHTQSTHGFFHQQEKMTTFDGNGRDCVYFQSLVLNLQKLHFQIIMLQKPSVTQEHNNMQVTENSVIHIDRSENPSST
jgi:hypothetical protein